MTQMILVPAHILEQAVAETRRSDIVINNYMGSYRDPIGPHFYEPYMSNSHRQSDVMCSRTGCGASRTNPIHV